MVLVEELNEMDDEVPEPSAEPETKGDEKAGPTKLKKGFLEGNSESLYPPEGSPEGVVSPDTHKAHTENKMNENLNDQMNRGAKENNGIERPGWYTKEWPKDCQYNSPGCYLDEMDTSVHASETHKKMTRGPRWDEAMTAGVKSMRLSFSSMTDEDLSEVIERIRKDLDVTELDLSHNHIKDTGIQTLVAALSTGAAPNLKELKVYSNEFGDLGKTMLTQGLPVFRKKLEVQWDEPNYAKYGSFTKPASAVPAAAGGYAAGA